MKIENIRATRRGNRKRVAANVTWEDSDRPAQELYFETEELFAEGLTCNPHTFLVSCIMPALHHGEERVFLDEEIGPEIRDGLTTAMGWIRHWYYRPERWLPRIEAKKISNTISTSPIPQRAGIFFSGGIDSLATLRANHRNYPSDHPWSIKDGLLVYGLEVDKQESFGHVVNSLSEVARDAGIALVAVCTNVRSLEDDWMFWEHAFHDAIFSAIAHAFSRRISVVSISSTYDIPHIRPYGTHPLLDIGYSSCDMRIRHDGIMLSRLTKAKLVAGWDVAFQNVRVCNKSELYRSGRLNCGECSKCVRTMLAFMALGVLEQTRAFPVHDVSEELLRSTIQIYSTTLCFYEELITPLAERGRHDLVRIIQRHVDEYHRRRRISMVKLQLSETVKQFDNRHLNGKLVEFKRSFLKKSTKKRC
jgi:hypothetical protein